MIKEKKDSGDGDEKLAAADARKYSRNMQSAIEEENDVLIVPGTAAP